MAIEPPLPENEDERLAALKRYDILDTQPELAFDLITAHVAYVLDAPITLISLIDEDRQWFKSRVGLDAEQTSRAISFCAHAINGDAVFMVGDAEKDARFHDNPLVLEAPSIRSYAGAPLVTSAGFRIGTLCAIHPTVVTLTEAQTQFLEHLAKWCTTLIERRVWDRAQVSMRKAAMC